MKLKLYGYWRSSATWRVKWAFELKKVSYEYIPVNILKAEHRSVEHLARNPMGALPVLEIAPSVFMSQSMSILFWIEETFNSEVSLFGSVHANRYKIIELCELINADIAPLQTPRVQKMHSSEDVKKLEWAQHFIRSGFAAYEKNMESLQTTGPYSLGEELTAADMFLVPQVYNAYRYKIDVAAEFPRIDKIYKHCILDGACSKCLPEKQSDAVV